ncbi:craniofacial development protein 2 [Biomphalaria glabrata]|nr:craniofacial development protein 2 [Biomphalaria glabrata]
MGFCRRSSTSVNWAVGLSEQLIDLGLHSEPSSHLWLQAFVCMRQRPHPGKPSRLMGQTRELAKYNVDIASLSETRLAEAGQLTEVGAGYTFFWISKNSEERHEAGIGFMVNKLAGFPKGLIDRLMTLRVPMTSR